jgi:hypothetical protein
LAARWVGKLGEMTVVMSGNRSVVKLAATSEIPLVESSVA